jgi:uncharacterized protein (DUF58 family)
LISLSLGVAASNSGNNLLYLIVGMTLALIVSSGLLSSLNLHKLRVTCRTPSLVYATEPAEVQFVVRNLKRRVPSLSVTLREASWRRVERGGQASQDAQEARIFYVFQLAPQASERLEAPYVFSSRGHYRLEGGRLFTCFPFGLFKKSLGLYTTTQISVSARRYALSTEHAERVLRYVVGDHDSEKGSEKGSEKRSEKIEALFTQGEVNQGEVNQGLRRGDELEGLRLLTPHEPITKIHWGATAKRGALVRREYAPERPVKRALWVNEHISGDVHLLATQEHHAWADLIASCVELLSRSAPLTVTTSSGARWLIEGDVEREALALWLVDAELTESPVHHEPPQGALIITHPQGKALLPSHIPPELIFESEQGSHLGPHSLSKEGSA